RSGALAADPEIVSRAVGGLLLDRRESAVLEGVEDVLPFAVVDLARALPLEEGAARQGPGAALAVPLVERHAEARLEGASAGRQSQNRERRPRPIWSQFTSSHVLVPRPLAPAAGRCAPADR